MKVRIAYTEEVNDRFRRGMHLFYGKEGLASRDEVKTFFWLYGQTMNDDINMLLDDEENKMLEGDSH